MKVVLLVLGRFIGVLLVAVSVFFVGRLIWSLPHWSWEYGLSINTFSGSLLLYLSALCLGCILLYACRGRINRNRVEWHQIEQVNDSFKAGSKNTPLPAWLKLIYMACGGLTIGVAVIVSLFNEFIVIDDRTISDAEYYGSMNALRAMVALALIFGGSLWFAMREEK
jgi:hypothetical protein